MEDGRRRAAANAIAAIWSFEIVELHEAVEAAIERRAAGEVVAPEDNAPVLGEDRLLQALHKAVRPGVARFDACVAGPQLGAGGGELGFELTAAIRQDARGSSRRGARPAAAPGAKSSRRHARSAPAGSGPRHKSWPRRTP